MGHAIDKNRTETQRVKYPRVHRTHVCGTVVGTKIETHKKWSEGVAQGAKLVLASLKKADGDFIAFT